MNGAPVRRGCGGVKDLGGQAGRSKRIGHDIGRACGGRIGIPVIAAEAAEPADALGKPIEND
jgi:hypothetical protein